MSNISNGSAYAENTLNGLIRMNDKNLAGFEQSDLVQPSQFYKRLPWFPASNGTQHKWEVETAAAGAAFRTINNGVTNGAGSAKTVTADLKFIDCGWTRDVQIGAGYSKGKAVYFEKQAMKGINAGMAKSEFSLIQGTAYDATGPDGLDDQVQSDMKVDAGGTGGTHVYMMILGEDDVCGIIGNGGDFSMSEVGIVKVTGDNGLQYNADNQDISGFMALQVAGKYSVVMAYNVDGTSGKNVSDTLLNKMFAKFPADRREALKARGIILMSTGGAEQLQNSRTYTSPTGQQADWPESWNFGIPIVVSDAVKDTYANVTTTTTEATTTTTTGE